VDALLSVKLMKIPVTIGNNMATEKITIPGIKIDTTNLVSFGGLSNFFSNSYFSTETGSMVIYLYLLKIYN